jgi:crotonobetainyl-CoA:carnitine CoA-transferase CaiB-like acyl-CoA transferase
MGSDKSSGTAVIDAEGVVAAAIAAEMWAGIGGVDGVRSRLRFTGEGDMSCPFPVMDLAAASFGVAGLAVSALLEAASVDAPLVTVDRRQATTWFDFPVAPSRFLDDAERHGLHQRWMAEFQTADGQWIRVQATYPTLRRRMLSALGLGASATPEDVRRTIAGLPAEEAEQRLVEAGAAAAAARSLEDWKRHPQGTAVALEPLATLSSTSFGPQSWLPTRGRPLLGIRVLDMTRVVAAPVATRFLASLGAEVLRIDRPDSDEVELLGVHDISLGKRWALLDARSAEGNRRLRELIAGADVMVHGYRPGALGALGLDAETRAQLRPGLVDVTLNAYGWTGPWRERRGFDTLVQFSSGIAHEVARWASQDPDRRLPLNALGHHVDASRPRHLPVEALDFSTGYQLAAAAIMGLVRRLEAGQGSLVQMSLARTARLLVDQACEPADPSFTLPDEDALMTDQVYGLGSRPTRRLAEPITIEGVPVFWDRPAERAGSSAAVWAGPDRN